MKKTNPYIPTKNYQPKQDFAVVNIQSAGGATFNRSFRDQFVGDNNFARLYVDGTKIGVEFVPVRDRTTLKLSNKTAVSMWGVLKKHFPALLGRCRTFRAVRDEESGLAVIDLNNPI